jgi:RNA polymerase sigma-70 factor (ECF subfamily)
MSDKGEATRILQSVTNGGEPAMDRLFPLVYRELRRIAQNLFADERPNHTLQATALVHEAFLKLIDQRRARYENRAHFFAVASQAMRRILVSSARKHRSAKRGSGRANLDLDAALKISALTIDDVVLDLDEALTELAKDYPDQAKVVEMRFFAGLTEEEIAGLMGVTSRTVQRYWRFARAWLATAMEQDSAE